MFDHLPFSWRPDPLSLFLAAVALSFLLHLRRRSRSKRPNQALPSPWRLPLIGNLHQLGSLPHRSLRTLSRKHGPVMLLHLGRVPTIVISSAAAAEEVLKTHDLAFATRPDSSMANGLLYGSRDILFSKYGNYWRQIRRISTTHMLSPLRVQSFSPIREEEMALLVSKIRAAAGPVNISELLFDLTYDVLCRAAFGRKFADEKGGGGGTRMRFSELSSELMTLMASFPVRDYVPLFGWVDWLSGLDKRMGKAALGLDAFIEEILEEHARKGERNNDDDNSAMDFVDILLSLGGTDGSEATFLTRETIKALILNMFAGGTDTTYAATEWAMAELVKHPEKMKRAQEEIRRIIGLKGKITQEMTLGMHYLKAVIKETLRLHPPGPLLAPHESTEDAQLQGYLIPKGTRVIVNAWAIARDPCSWEAAEEFRPERFLEKTKSVDFKGQVDFHHIPFGTGRRGCPGIEFALALAEIALANLLYHFDWELPDREEEMDMCELFALVVRKKSNIILLHKTPNFKLCQMPAHQY